MARHDLRCIRCGYIHRDVDIPISQGALRYCSSTGCLKCYSYDEDGAPTWGKLEPIPAIRLSLFSDADPRSSPHDFAKSTVQMETPDGGYRDVTVSSLRDIRRLERESEQAERDGWGRKCVWRDYSNDHSNWDKHTLGEDPSLRPAKTFLNGQPVVNRRGAPVIADHGTLPEEE